MRAGAYRRLRPIWSEYSSSNRSALQDCDFSDQAFWTCACGVDWLGTVESRAKALTEGCKACRKLKAMLKVADGSPLTSRPELLTQWAYELNALDPRYYSLKSSLLAWWSCEICSGTYQRSISARSRAKSGFSVCAPCAKSADKDRQKALLKLLHGIDEGWLKKHYIESESSLEEILAAGGPSHTLIRRALKLYSLVKNDAQIEAQRQAKKVSTSIERYGGYSPHLSLRGKTSAPELEIKAILESASINFIHGDWSTIAPKELDFYLPDHRIAIEYNGLHWHDKKAWAQDLLNQTTESREASKTDLCSKLGIELLHIWEDQWLKLEDKNSWLLGKIAVNKGELHGS